MSINWGDYKFEKIEPFDTWIPPSYGGIYAITCISDPVNKPNVHTRLYFGETGNFAKRVTINHEKYRCWKLFSTQKKMYVSIHKDDDDDSRKRKERELIRTRYTPCNNP